MNEGKGTFPCRPAILCYPAYAEQPSMVKQVESSSSHFMPCLDGERGTQHLLSPLAVIRSAWGGAGIRRWRKLRGEEWGVISRSISAETAELCFLNILYIFIVYLDFEFSSIHMISVPPFISCYRHYKNQAIPYLKHDPSLHPWQSSYTLPPPLKLHCVMFSIVT